MILEIYKRKYGIGQTAKLQCDKCGKVYDKAVSVAKKTEKHYCSRFCAGLGNDGISGRCIICGKDKDDTFYDKGIRPLCSKACYSAWFDKHLAYHNKYERTTTRQLNGKIQVKPGMWYKQGRLLTNYNLGV